LAGEKYRRGATHPLSYVSARMGITNARTIQQEKKKDNDRGGGRKRIFNMWFGLLITGRLKNPDLSIQGERQVRRGVMGYLQSVGLEKQFIPRGFQQRRG